MNEPSNFVLGSTARKGCPYTTSKYDSPPYTPGVVLNSLVANTVCPSAQQYLSSHYNLHNLFGHLEVVATHKYVFWGSNTTLSHFNDEYYKIIKPLCDFYVANFAIIKVLNL